MPQAFTATLTEAQIRSAYDLFEVAIKAAGSQAARAAFALMDDIQRQAERYNAKVLEDRYTAKADPDTADPSAPRP